MNIKWTGHNRDRESDRDFDKDRDREMDKDRDTDRDIGVFDMKVQGQLACPRIKQKHKKKSCERYICPFVHTSNIAHP